MIKIVTDSCACLDPKVAEAHGIAVVPLYVIFGEESYRDGVEMSAEAFFDRLRSLGETPTTSQPTPGDFLKVYEAAAEESDVEGIVVICLSGRVSGTVNSAQQAAGQFDALPVRVIDTQSATMGEAYVALEAAQAAGASQSLEEVVHVAERATRRTALYAAVDTLEYLQRNGRIGRAQALAGGLLKMKPVITVGPHSDGVVEGVENARTRPKALRTVLDHVDAVLKENGADPSRCEMAVVHTHEPDAAEAFRQQVEERFAPSKLTLSILSPVIGCHVGPGLLGLASFFETPA